MATKIAEAYVEIRATADQLGRDLGGAEGLVEKSASTMSQSISRALTGTTGMEALMDDLRGLRESIDETGSTSQSVGQQLQNGGGWRSVLEQIRGLIPSLDQVRGMFNSAAGGSSLLGNAAKALSSAVGLSSGALGTLRTVATGLFGPGAIINLGVIAISKLADVMDRAREKGHSLAEELSNDVNAITGIGVAVDDVDKAQASSKSSKKIMDDIEERTRGNYQEPEPEPRKLTLFEQRAKDQEDASHVRPLAAHDAAMADPEFQKHQADIEWLKSQRDRIAAMPDMATEDRNRLFDQIRSRQSKSAGLRDNRYQQVVSQTMSDFTLRDYVGNKASAVAGPSTNAMASGVSGFNQLGKIATDALTKLGDVMGVAERSAAVAELKRKGVTEEELQGMVEKSSDRKRVNQAAEVTARQIGVDTSDVRQRLEDKTKAPADVTTPGAAAGEPGVDASGGEARPYHPNGGTMASSDLWGEINKSLTASDPSQQKDGVQKDADVPKKIEEQTKELTEANEESSNKIVEAIKQIVFQSAYGSGH